MSIDRPDPESPSTVLVVGGTGAMGSAVARRLIETTAGDIRVLTRDPTSPGARRLHAASGPRLELVEGDLDDPSSLRAATEGVDRVFANTDFFSSGSVLGEARQGRSLLDAARAAGVDRFVWSSLDDASRLSRGRIPVPHFDSKAAVEAWIQANRSEELMRQEVDGWFTHHVTVLTTAPYYENLLTTMRPEVETLADGSAEIVVRLPLGTARYPLIALSDIAWFACHVLEHWQDGGARDLAIVADALTGDEIAAALSRALDRPARYVDLPLDVLRRSVPDVGHDFEAMARYLQSRDLFSLDRDIEMLRRLHPRLLSLEQWLDTIDLGLLMSSDGPEGAE